MAVEVLKKRFIYTFGGKKDRGSLKEEKTDKEYLMRHDTYKPTKVWELLIVENPSNLRGYEFGVFLN